MYPEESYRWPVEVGFPSLCLLLVAYLSQGLPRYLWMFDLAVLLLMSFMTQSQRQISVSSWKQTSDFLLVKQVYNLPHSGVNSESWEKDQGEDTDLNHNRCLSLLAFEQGSLLTCSTCSFNVQNSWFSETSKHDDNKGLFCSILQGVQNY